MITMDSIIVEVQAYIRQFDNIELSLNLLKEVAQNMLQEFLMEDEEDRDLECFLQGIFTCGNWEDYKESNNG